MARIQTQKTPPLAQVKCPGCQTVSAYLNVTGQHRRLYLTCPRCDSGKSKGEQFTVRYLHQLDWDRDIEFLNGWTSQQLYQLGAYYNERYTPREQVLVGTFRPHEPPQDFDLAEAWMRVRCPACQTLERSYLVPTKRPKGRASKRTGGVPYLKCYGCSGSLLGRVMVARYLGRLVWSQDIVILEGRGWDLGTVRDYVKKFA